jgi:putative protein-disulfide isomerase
MTARLIYGFDPLCGWCFGFAPALRAVRAAFPDLPIDLRMGGLMIGPKVRPYTEMSDYIRNASERLQAVTGVTLGEDFKRKILANPSAVASSIPPCDVLLQARRTFPEHVLDIAEAIQVAHFRDGMDLNDPRTYQGIGTALGLALSPSIPEPNVVRVALEQEFSESRALGLTSFPSLLMLLGESHVGLEVSYDPKTLVKRISEVLSTE